MVTGIYHDQRPIVGKGRTELLCETFCNFHPPMSKIINETFDVQITDCTVFRDRVLVKGIVERTFYYKHPHLGKKEEHGKKEDSGKKDESGKKEDSGGKNNSGTRDDDSSRKEGDGQKEESAKREESAKKDKEQSGESQEQQSNSAKNAANHNQNTNNQHSKKENKNHVAGETHKTGFNRLEQADSLSGIIHFCQQSLDFAATVEVPGANSGDDCHVEKAEVKDFDTFVATRWDKNGLITAGKQMFIVDIALKTTRNDGNFHNTQQEFPKAAKNKGFDERNEHLFRRS